jgi:acetate kinase
VAGLTGDVLVVNAGSTSLKLSVVAADGASRAVASLVEAPPVAAVGHRVVHGGEHLTDPTPIDDGVLAQLEALVELAPLHNEPAVRAIEEARRALPNALHVAVFDTAFHRTIPDVARTYALPKRYRDLGVRRFGFHGLSVQWVSEQVVVPRLVVCHLGGGASVTALRDGRSADTTMGFTPLEGVPMATRAGSFDPGALLYLLREGVQLADLDHALEHESGLTGLAGTGDVAQLERDPSPDAALALELYCYRIAQAVAAMTAALGGLDALAFTAGVGENSEVVRAKICSRLTHLGAYTVHVVPAREDVVVARAVRSVAAAKPQPR